MEIGDAEKDSHKQHIPKNYINCVSICMKKGLSVKKQKVFWFSCSNALILRLNGH